MFSNHQKPTYPTSSEIALYPPLPLRFQNSLGDRWGVRGSIGLGILAVAVQVVVFRVILVENLPPKVKQSIDEPYEPWNLEVFSWESKGNYPKCHPPPIIGG